MPTITATPVPAAGLIQVDVDWSDSPTVGFARLERVNIADGTVQTVRPHTALATALGQFMRLSNGRGRWFDTDAPFDTPVTYRVYADEFADEGWYGASSAAIVRDAFGRTVGAGATWGTPDTGAAYTAFLTTTEATVAGGEGTLSLPTKNVLRGQRLAGAVTRADWDIRFRVGIDSVPTGDHPLVWTYLRLDPIVDNYVALAVQFRTTGVIGWQISKEVAGVATAISGAVSGPTFDATNGVDVHVQAIGDLARIKIWAQTQAEPVAWTAEAAIPDVPQVGAAALVGFVPTAVGNALPYVFDFDNLVAMGSDAEHSAQVSLSSEGHAWLRDPLRPCSSIRLEACVDVSTCVDSNDGFELGTAAGWTADNATLTAEAATPLEGAYRGKLTVNYAAGQTFNADTPWSTTRYTFDATAEGWAGEGGVTVARVTSPTPHDGAGMLRASKTMGAGFDSVRFNDNSGLPDDISAGGPTMSMWAQVPAASPGTNWLAHIEVQDSGFTWQPGADVAMTPGVWRLLTFTPPAGLLANSRAVGVQFSATGVNGAQVVYIDTVRQGASPAAQLVRRVPVVAGGWVRARGWLMAPVDGTQARLAVNWMGAGGYISTSAGPLLTLVGGIWTFAEALVEAPAGTTSGELTWTTAGIPTSGTIIYGDAFTFAARAPQDGAFFVSMDTERRDPNSSSTAPVNRRLPITASRVRRGVESTLTLATARFADRDALINITLPGTPLLFSAPVEYGIPPRYWDVGATDVARGMPDHRFQPRIHSLPVGEREAPVGPGKAACGVAYDDGCATPALTTWQQVADAGMTWLDLTDVT
jgi:hypothetical protein